MTQSHIGTRMLYGVGVAALGLAMATPVWSMDSTQSIGPGVHQGEDGTMSTRQGGNTGPTTGRNEHSGSATGAVRDLSQAEPPHDKNRGSHQLGSRSSQEASQSKERNPSDSHKEK